MTCLNFLKRFLILCLSATFGGFTPAAEAGAAAAQQAVDRTVLPIPLERYKGKVGRYVTESDKPSFPAQSQAPKGAPNVLVILLDDVGFGQMSTFGGGIETPSLDSLSRGGLVFNNFHTTAMCSPTRAALLTGRNHHSAGSGKPTEIANGYDGYNSIIHRDTATVAEILKQNGYATAMFGKHHNTPLWETSPVGPFDRWPTGLGFEYFYGFLGGDTDQFAPTLYENTTPIIVEQRPADYHLTADLANRAINWVRYVKSITPEKPFFVYVAPGATHSPHQAPKEWIDKFKGQFDKGWDEYRKTTFDRQKRLGIVPANTELTARPAGIAAWDPLTSEQKRLYARMMEVYAGFTAHTDHEMGRIIEAVRALPDGDNTMIIYIAGDNGASAEGGPDGLLNEASVFNVALPENFSESLCHMGELGSPLHYNHFPFGWAHAMNTPFQFYKMVASHFGGTRNGLVMSWPAGIKGTGILSQFHHVIDIVPTILEIAELPEPTRINGVTQKPIEGVSMVYTFDHPKSANRHLTQYFELAGNRAVYNDGWVAAAKLFGITDSFSGKLLPSDPSLVTWELYHVRNDFSQAHDLATQSPQRLNDLQDLFWSEAEKYNVLPITGVSGISGADQPSYTHGKNSFTYYPGTHITEQNAPNIKNRSFHLRADVVIETKEDSGVLVAQGGRPGGYSMFVQDGKLHFAYNFLNRETTVVSSSGSLAPGKTILAVDFLYDGNKPGMGGNVTLLVNGRNVGTGRIEKTVPIRFSLSELFNIGMDSGTPVAASYNTPFRFTGKIEKVSVELQD